MLRDSVGRCRPIERLCCTNGMRVVDGPGLREGRFYVVDRRLIIMVPDWAKGRQMREAIIARQLCLFTLVCLGEAEFGAGLSDLTCALARRLEDEAA